MTGAEWSNERCDQLLKLEKVLREVASANSANNFIRRMNEAQEIAESLINSPDLSFLGFLKNLAINDRESRWRHDRDAPAETSASSRHRRRQTRITEKQTEGDHE